MDTERMMTVTKQEGDFILVAFTDCCAHHGADFEVCDHLTCRLARAIETESEEDYQAVMDDAMGVKREEGKSVSTREVRSRGNERTAAEAWQN